MTSNLKSKEYKSKYKMDWIKIGKFSTRYFCPKDYNEGDDKFKIKGLVLMLHGSFHNGNYWTNWAANLASRGYLVFVPDLLGYGKSKKGFSAVTGDLMVKELSSLIKQISLGYDKKLLLFSHSISGPYGFKLSQICDEYISKLIAISPGPINGLELQTSLQVDTTKDFYVDLMPKVRINFIKNLKFIEASDEIIHEYFLDPLSDFEDLELYQQNYIEKTPSSLLKERLNINNTQIKFENNFISKNPPKIYLIGGGHDKAYPKEYFIKLQSKLIDKGFKVDFFQSELLLNNGHMLMLERNSNDIIDYIFETILLPHPIHK
jgi:pimeloyl-ACP methyl ester carboxylesterase